MKAVSNVLSKPDQGPSKERSNDYPQKGDTVFALIRRLSARVKELEESLSTLRRDVNRIDRANYRAKDSRPSQPGIRTAEDPDPSAGSQLGGLDIGLFQ